MVENTCVIILQCQLRGRHVLMDRLIVTEHVGWDLYGDNKHLQIVPKGIDQFGCCLESNELASERTSLNSVMLLIIP